MLKIRDFCWNSPVVNEVNSKFLLYLGIYYNFITFLIMVLLCFMFLGYMCYSKLAKVHCG